jgi:hypothetical protein
MLSGVELCRSARFNSALVAFGLEHTEKWREGIHLFLTTTFEADSAPSRTLEVDFSRRSSFHLQLAVFTTQERKQGLVRHLCDGCECFTVQCDLAVLGRWLAHGLAMLP